jgi:Family of unknown function (DUF6065)
VKLTAYVMDGQQIKIQPAPLERDWMTATGHFAYRCLPLNIANAHGWEILCPSDCSAIWGGAAVPQSLQVKRPDDALAPAVSHFGFGILTFHIPCIFQTDTGYDLMVQGPVNRPKDAVAPLSAIVETDWAPFTFTMNWMFTRANTEVNFERGEPICHVYPLKRGDLEACEPRLEPLANNAELQSQFMKWTASRSTFIKELKEPESLARSQLWEKQYFRGLDAFGRPANQTKHYTKLNLRKFTEDG